MRRSFSVLFLSASVGLLQAQPDPSSVYAWYAGDVSLSVLGTHTVNAWTNLGTAATDGTYTQAKRTLNRMFGTPEKLWLRFANDEPAAALRLDGTQGIWATQTDFGALAGERTVICYVRLHKSTSQGFLFDSSSFVTGLTRAQVNGGNWQFSTYGKDARSMAAAPGTVTATATTNSWQVHTFLVRTNGGEPVMKHFINGVQAHSFTNEVVGALGGMIVGMNVSAAIGIQANIAEMLVFNSALGDTERSGIESYLQTKWNGVKPDPNAPPRPAAQFVRVFAAGDGYTCYRIPAIVTTTKGTLIAVSDGRIGGCGDIPTPLDLVCKRSFDNGETWGPLQVIADYGSNPDDRDTYPFYGVTNILRVSSGDAALLVDRTNGRVWTLYDNGGVLNGSRKIKLELRYSDDDGATWSPAIDLEATYPGIRPSKGEFVAGPGNGIQMTEGPYAGRLIFPVYTISSPEGAMALYSDDHGVTWQRGESIAGGGETQIAETAGGGLIASMRDGGFPWSGVRTFSRSTDGGQTWSAPYKDLESPSTIPDPVCQGNIFRLTTTQDSNRSRLIHANAAHPSSRVNMTLRISYDDGATWAVSNQVYGGGSAYSSVTKLATGEIGLLFERDPYGSLDFVRRSVSQITDGEDSLPPFTVWAGGHFSPAQLMDPAISGAEADPDKDGFNNEQEFEAGTDPLDAASRLRLNITPGQSQKEALLYFEAMADKTYTVQFRDQIDLGPWERYADIEALPTNTVVQLAVSQTNRTRFYRLATPLIDQ